MSIENWEKIIVLAGDLQAEILRGLLEAQGIPARLSKEGAGKAIGLNVGPLGEIEILVPARLREAADKVLDNYYAGVYAAEEGSLDFADSGSPESDDLTEDH